MVGDYREGLKRRKIVSEKLQTNKKLRSFGKLPPDFKKITDFIAF